MATSTVDNKGVQYIDVKDQDFKIAVPKNFLSEEQMVLASDIGYIPGVYADGTAKQADGTIINLKPKAIT